MASIQSRCVPSTGPGSNWTTARGGVRESMPLGIPGGTAANAAEGDFTFVHGSPREPTNEYVFPEDIYNHRKMDTLFGMITEVLLSGAHPHSRRIHVSNGVHHAGRLRLRVPLDSRKDHDQRRLGGAAARQRPTVLLRDPGRGSGDFSPAGLSDRSWSRGKSTPRRVWTTCWETVCTRAVRQTP
jgi:hypothetical protein